MERIVVRVPDMGERKKTDTVLNAWLVKVGAQVQAGDDLAELVTDKATFLLPAPVAGRVHGLLLPEGASVKAGDALAEIETPSASVAKENSG
jgi:pyruvate/2-oxoglutarate dehydrogenase complex dihydrolipoamide acyltransferase (E2) component